MRELVKSKNMKLGIIICVFSAVIFGLYPPASRVAYQDGANITFVILVTTFCRLASLYAFTVIKKYKVFDKYEEYKFSLIAGVFQALSITGILAGTYFLPGAVVISIMFSYSLMLLLFSAWRKKLRMNRINLLSTLGALFGLALVLNVYSYQNEYHIMGIAFAVLAAFATFARSYIYGQQSHTRNPIVIGAESFLIAFPILLLLIFWKAPVLPENFDGYLMTGLASVALSVGGFGLFYGISILGAYRFSMIMKLEPIFTIIFGVLIAKDYLASSQYFGIVIVLLSLVALQLFDKQKEN